MALGLLLVLPRPVLGAEGTGAGATGGADLQQVLGLMAAMGDRTTGSSGCAKTADFIYKTFQDLGFEEVGRHRYLLPVMRYQGARLTLPDRKLTLPLKAFALNAMTPESTPSSGLEGPLLYVGSGEPQRFNGKQPSGSIVIMEMDSGKNWLNAATLGARALIYVDRGASAKGFFQEKGELTPVRFPRFWVPLSEVRGLFGSFEAAKGGLLAPHVRLKSTGGWERTTAENIFALVPGVDPELKGQLLVVEAFYDSTGLVAGASPGADEASSMATLLELARTLRTHPPGRSVLLVATSGHAQSLTGLREFVWAVRATGKEQKELEQELKETEAQAEAALEALESPVPLEERDRQALGVLQLALLEEIKTEVDRLGHRLMQLRLGEGEPDQELIRELAARRLLLRRLAWRNSLDNLGPDERRAVAELIPPAVDYNQALLEDVRMRLACLKSAERLRRLVQGSEIAAFVSLHLSSHGSGVGAFSDGWLYQLQPEVNRTQVYSSLNEILTRLAAPLEERLGLKGFFRDTLRPSHLRSWQSYLGDQPALGGEVTALAGMLGLTLVTVDDGRPFWGTPFDTPKRVNWPYLKQQGELVAGLVAGLSRHLELAPQVEPTDGFATLVGRAKFIRQGEIFPDQPAPGTVVLAYQGQSLFYAMVDSRGTFEIRGLADSRHVLGKAILEGYRFDPESGAIIWAIDKRQTGKNAYRVSMARRTMETDLVMFACDMTTLFDVLEPRTFNYLTKIEVLDGRRDAEPLHYWFSRIDTRASILVSIFLEPGTPLKATLSDTVLRRKLILLNASKSHPEGIGYRVEKWPVIPATAYRVARDMWHLVLPRIQILERHGIVNDRINALAQDGRAAVERARQALVEQQYDRFLEEARSSWALATRVYNDVEQTQRDVLFGVLFYVALFVPFAYCMERLLFGLTDIRKRIVAFLAILVAVIGLISQVHPAFHLTYSPIVVILAFFILGLSTLVGFIIFGRFEQEMAELQRRARHLRTSEISRGKAFAAAFVLGVSNLRRRPLRTALTCITLVILTFTIMSFTTVKSVRYRSSLRLQDQAPYRHAVLLKALGWEDLPPEALDVVTNAVSGEGLTAPRAWLVHEDKTRPPMVPLRRDLRHITALGMIGLSAREPQVSGLDEVLGGGRWFVPGERRAILLSERVARELGISLENPGGEEILLWGMPFRVVGWFRGEALQKRPDLDGEPLTPAVYPSEAAMEMTEVEAEAIESGEEIQMIQGRYQHLPADLVVIVPYEMVMALGGSLEGVAVHLDSEEATRRAARHLADRFGLAVFSGEAGGVFMYHIADALSYSGVPNILIPILISALIVLNTMISSVYERKREIQVYTSVGLAPSHVSFLFIAESLAFAVVSAVLGYLVAQTAASLFAATPLWRGVTVNYSSLAGVAAMMLIMAVVLVSVLYPSRVAAAIAIPDVNRAWTLPAPWGNQLVLTLPFLMKYQEQRGIGAFLRDYYLAHQDVSHGLFSTDDLSVGFYCPATRPVVMEDGVSRDENCLQLNTRVWLAPFDLGVKQRVELLFQPAADDPRFLEIQIALIREAGEANAWRRISKAFLDDLRKQLLIWRSLDEETQSHYEAKLSAVGPSGAGKRAAGEQPGRGSGQETAGS
jgi:FtsX-like permease family/Peptidase family M28